MDMSDIEQAAARFLYEEARLADGNLYAEWLALWDQQDIRYWIPSNEDESDPTCSISIVNDDRTGLEKRITRLRSRAAYSQKPRSRMLRLVSNVVVTAQDAGSVDTSSAFIIVELRNGHQDVVAGRAFHRLRVLDEGFLIQTKRVLLVNNDDYIDNLSFLI